MAQLVLIRGLPGSGKSTMARERFRGFSHYEADMWHMRDGVYQYNPEKARDAHEWCQAKTLLMLRRQRNVVVSNTFTRYWEMEPYFRMLQPHDTLTIFVAKGNYPNVHGVPEDAIQRMRDRWED